MNTFGHVRKLKLLVVLLMLVNLTACVVVEHGRGRDFRTAYVEAPHVHVRGYY